MLQSTKLTSNLYKYLDGKRKKCDKLRGLTKKTCLHCIKLKLLEKNHPYAPRMQQSNDLGKDINRKSTSVRTRRRRLSTTQRTSNLSELHTFTRY